MFELLLTALYLHIPIVIGGVLHMVLVSRQYCPKLAIAIYSPWFGANKTWRGMIAVPLLTAFGALCLWPINTYFNFNILGQSLFDLLSIGLIAGLGYVLAELPNSFIKRRLGIGAGQVPTRGKYIVILADQLDSGIGFSIAYYWYLQLSMVQALVCALSFPITALIVKRLLFMAKLKKSAT
jgi:hypothetical protein